MLTLDTIKEQLKDSNLMAVSKSAGVHYNSLYSLMKGSNPSYSTVKALSDYLENKNNA